MDMIFLFLAALTHWVVPATGEEQFLPDRDPEYAKKGGTIHIVAAQGEYEPGSFVLKSDVDLGKVKLEVGALTSANGDVFPAREVDLKVVKVWYQNRNGWFTYFGDTGFKLCPELLLNDEDLVRVDTAKVANYAKLTDADGNKIGETWINPPRQMNVRTEEWRASDKGVFQYMRPNFKDAKTLQPVALGKDVRKQFFLTVRVPEGTAAGVYTGEVKVIAEGGRWSVPLSVKVLDFSLPRPKTYFDPDKDFLVTAFNYLNLDILRDLNGGDLELAKKQFKAVLLDEARHGVQFYPIWNGVCSDTDFFIRTMQEVGMRTDILRGGAKAKRSITWRKHDPKLTYEDMVKDAKEQADYYDRTLGHHNIYIFHGDEPSAEWIAKERPLLDAYREGGLKCFIACHRALFHKGAHVWDFTSTSKSPNDDTTPKLWNQLGNVPYVGWYGHMHVGNENPAQNRRQNGLAAYLSGYSALCNYAFHLGPWNDDSTTYKPMVNVYGTYDGVVGTLQWEGFREGVDDIRYATLLTALARKAIKSPNFRIAREGRKALRYMAELQMGSDDYIGTGADPLETVRLEMIARIEKLRGILGKEATYEEKPIIVKRFVGECTDPLGGKQELWGEHGYARFSDWKNIRRIAEERLSDPKQKKRLVSDGRTMRLFASAYLMTGARDTALELLRLTEENKFLADVLEGKMPKWNADPKKAFKEIERAGSFLLLTGDEAGVRRLAAVKESLVKPRARKVYPVAYSSRTLSGLGDWDKAAAGCAVQKLDRAFGGNMDFLVTDITSGNRGAGVGSEKNAKGEFATMRIICDQKGLHFRFDEKNPDAEAIACRAKSGGAFECYLAPGERWPYVSFMPDQETGRCSVFNTTYDTYGIRAVPSKGLRAVRTEVAFNDGVATTYVYIPWDSYAELVPHDGDEWEFEAVLWNKRGGSCWNGTESIHGRSTWGRLKFMMPEAARAAIVKRQLFLAKKSYEREKVTWDSGMGMLDFWKDSDLGDVDFYAAKVAPLENELDAAAKNMSFEMTNDEVFRYEREILPKWYDIRFILSDLRRDWLLENGEKR